MILNYVRARQPLHNSLHENPLVRRQEASEFEVGPMKIENQEVQLALIFIKLFMIYFRGPVKIIGGQ